ncbi:hypothetical protein [Methylobacterium sp. ID0610]|uniref:hypothetical protein n=1 Tax=Methylobacterium carpenticola TaxID=3344827 RepID=UPI0036CEEFE6
MAEKTVVTLVQNAAGQTVAVKIGGSEAIPVLLAGPIVAPGQMNCSITIANVEFAYETADAAPAASPTA